MPNTYNTELFIGVGLSLVFSVVGYLTAFVNKRKTQAEIDNFELKGRLAESERQQALARLQEQVRLETAREKAELARALELAAQEQRNAQASVTEKLNKISEVGEMTHANTNSARTAMEKIEMELRNQLEAQKLAASNAATAALLSAQAARDLAARDLQAERDKNLHLTEQLAALMLPPRLGSAPEAAPVEVSIVADKESPVPVQMVPHPKKED